MIGGGCGVGVGVGVGVYTGPSSSTRGHSNRDELSKRAENRRVWSRAEPSRRMTLIGCIDSQSRIHPLSNG